MKKCLLEKLILTSLFCLFLSSCAKQDLSRETKAKKQIENLEKIWLDQTTNIQPKTNAPLIEWVQFAVFNNPKVKKNYLDWAIAVNAINYAKVRPDLQIALSLDITKTIEAIMAGIMWAYPNQSKINRNTNMATIESEKQYLEFQLTLGKLAYEMKNLYTQIYFNMLLLQQYQQKKDLKSQQLKNLELQYSTNNSSLNQILAIKQEINQIEIEIKNQHSYLKILETNWAETLGLTNQENNFSAPIISQLPTVELPSEKTLQANLLQNIETKKIILEQEKIQIQNAINRRSHQIDWSAGLEIDLKSTPLMLTPSVGFNIPLSQLKINTQKEETKLLHEWAETDLKKEQIAQTNEAIKTYYELKTTKAILNDYEKEIITQTSQQLELTKIAYSLSKTELNEIFMQKLDLLERQIQILTIKLKTSLLENNFFWITNQIAESETILTHFTNNKNTNERAIHEND